MPEKAEKVCKPEKKKQPFTYRGVVLLYDGM
jgi:hypothetical protein